MNDYRIITPVFNPEPEFVDHLSNLEINCPGSLSKLIIVDDGSSNETLSIVLKRFPFIKLLREKGDLWWGGGIRAGMQEAVAHGVDVVVWLNSDCLPDPGSIPILVSHATREGVGAVSGWCYTRGSPECGFSPGFRNFRALYPDDEDVAKKREILASGVNGNFVAIPASVVRSIGFPDTSKHPHYMDGPYTYQIAKGGLQVSVLPHCRASLIRDFSRSIDVYSHSLVWNASLHEKFMYNMFSFRSIYHWRNRFFSVIEFKGMIFGFPWYIATQFLAVLRIVSGHMGSLLISRKKRIDYVCVKYRDVTPRYLLEPALENIS